MMVTIGAASHVCSAPHAPHTIVAQIAQTHQPKVTILIRNRNSQAINHKGGILVLPQALEIGILKWTRLCFALVHLETPFNCLYMFV